MYSKTEEADRKVVDRLGELAEKRGVPRAQLALAWMLSKPFVTSPIVGAAKPNHLADAVAALSLRLTPEEIAALEEAYTPHPVPGFSSAESTGQNENIEVKFALLLLHPER